MKSFFLTMIVVTALFLFNSCVVTSSETNWDLVDQGGLGDSGNFKINLTLPLDPESVCHGYQTGLTENDYAYCIKKDDVIKISIFSASDPSEKYFFEDRIVIKVNDYSASGGNLPVSVNLSKNSYYRLFVEVVNVNEKLKLTGGLDGIHYPSTDSVNIFLGTAGDFVRVVSDRSDEIRNFGSLKSYIESGGSKGAAAVALKNGKIYLSGGYSFDYEQTMRSSTIFDMRTLTSSDVANLPAALMDHAAALLDDGSEAGIVVIAFGSNEEGHSNAILAYDPDLDNYKTLAVKDSLTNAKAISIDGDVYIIGGCNGKTGSKKVYKVSKTTLAVEDFASLNAGRCNHSIADISTTSADGKTVPRILVIGGSADQDGLIPVLDKFAEVVTEGKSAEVAVSDRDGGDSAELLVRGLVAAAATTIRFDDLEQIQKAVPVVGGYFQDGEAENLTLIANPNLFVFSETAADKWVYDVNMAPLRCARPSMTAIGTVEKSPAQYAAVNCGSHEISRNEDADQTIFVVQVKRSYNSDLGQNIFSSSVKESLMEENKDIEGGGMIVDGPIAVDSLGQAFAFGSLFVYQISGYSIPY